MFVGREKELSVLNSLYETNQFQMPVIYGRRRVGKSTLIHKFVENKKSVIFTAIESTADRNLELFSKAILKTFFPEMTNMPPFGSFEDAFDFLTENIKNERFITQRNFILFLVKFSYCRTSLSNQRVKASSLI